MADNTIGWGQGAVNNTNGFGKGASNNSISWGLIHGESYGHDETNLTGGGGVTTIYGLQFDGVSNSLSNPDIDAPLNDFYTEFIVSDVDATAVRRALWTQNNDFLGFYYDATRYLFYRTGTNVYPYSSYSADNTPPLTGLNTIRLTRTGSDSEVSVNGEVVSVSPVNTSGVFITTIGANPGGSIAPFKGVLVEYSDSDGNTYNDANSWGGGTINGATRVQSTDNGVTWTPA